MSNDKIIAQSVLSTNNTIVLPAKIREILNITPSEPILFLFKGKDVIVKKGIITIDNGLGE